MKKRVLVCIIMAICLFGHVSFAQTKALSIPDLIDQYSSLYLLDALYFFITLFGLFVLLKINKCLIWPMLRKWKNGRMFFLLGVLLLVILSGIFFFTDSLKNKTSKSGNPERKIKVGLIVNEFFGGAGTAFGGYGFLARNYIAKYIPNENIQVDVLLGAGKSSFFAEKERVDNVDVYRRPIEDIATQLWLKMKRYDIYLSIEILDDAFLKNERNKDKKLILWIQDPRPQYEWDEIKTVQLFQESSYYNQRMYDTVNDWYRQKRIKFISQGYFLNQKAIDLYQLSPNVDIQYLPNPTYIDENFDVKTYKKKNNIVFLGRIESVKRGWLFCEIAKRMPEYEFYMLGQTFQDKAKSDSIMDQYKDIPNLHFVGHVEGEEKNRYLKEAKILVNTSIHEALPLSFLEALSYGVCLVSNRNPEDLTSRFGVWTGQINGDGFDKVDLYVNAIKTLMNDEHKRQKLSEEAVDYIKQRHNIPAFINDLRRVIYKEVQK